ncbi:MAG: hypothetical protein WAS36_02360 [Candidatus Saccharimonadales bacterium]
MKKSFSSLGNIGKSVLVSLVALSAIAALLSYKLLSLTGNRYSSSEVTTFMSAQSWRFIYDNPLELPHKLIIWTVSTLGQHSYGVTRITSVLFAAAAVFLFYYIVRSWLSKRVAILSTVLFAFSNGFLHSGRLGTAAVLQFSVLVLFAMPILIHQAAPGWRRRLIYMSSVIFAALVYIPGLIWQILLTIVLRRKKLFRLWSRLALVHKSIIVFASLLAIAPLVWAFIRTPQLLLTWLGLPQNFPAIDTILNNAQTLISTLFYHSGFSPEYVTHGGALLTIAELVLLILGVYAQLKRPRHNTNYHLLGAIGIATALILVSGGMFIPALVPLLYLLIAGGMYYFLNEWLAVFPRNPIARGIGVGVIVLIVVFALGYHTRSYFDAWPNNVVTKQVFSIEQK